MEQGETIEASAKREVRRLLRAGGAARQRRSPAPCSPPRAAPALPQLLEEAGITATCMQHCGLLTFVFDDNPQPWEVHGEMFAHLNFS